MVPDNDLVPYYKLVLGDELVPVPDDNLVPGDLVSGYYLLPCYDLVPGDTLVFGDW